MAGDLRFWERLSKAITLACVVGLSSCGAGPVEHAPSQPADPAPRQGAPLQAAAPALTPAQSPPASQPAVPATSPATPRPVKPRPPLGPPPVEFTPKVLDLGNVKPSTSADATVTIQNVSDKWLTIKASRADCTCTSVNLANTQLAPGQAIPMDVSYHASSSMMGPRNSKVKILFEGYDVVEVPVIANVGLPVRAEPSYIDALKHEDGTQTLSGQVTVFSLDQKVFRVLGINGKAPAFVNFDPASDAPRNSYIIKWDFTGFDQGTCKNAAGERFPRCIIVETDHAEAPVFDLEIRHDCNLRSRIAPTTPMDTWAISDKRLVVGAIKPGQSAEVDVQLKWLPKRDHQAPPSAVVSESGQFTAQWVSVREDEDGMTLRMRITAAKDARGLISGVVRVHSNRQSAPVDVIATVRE